MEGIKKLALRQLKINTPAPKPPVSGGDFHHWADADLSAITTRASGCEVLGEDVIGALELAFARQLARDTVWDLSALSPDHRALMVKAARVFKRGVAVQGVDEVKIPAETVSLISMVDDDQKIFEHLCSSDLVIVDENVAKYWWHQLPQGFVAISFSERGKTVDQVNHIAQLITARSDGNGVLYVIGGGVAGDVCGFAAGLTGRAFVFVPTTLLAMVDSSIGGKVGVNFGAWGKNQLGLFYLPRRVIIWNGWLGTLPSRELGSGLAEAYKHALLSGDEQLRTDLGDAATLMEDAGHFMVQIAPKLMQIIAVKHQVVSRDPFEQGERAILNFGHTVGHALETLAAENDHDVTHGECVALGIFHALKLSQKYTGFERDEIVGELRAFGLLPAMQRIQNIWGSALIFERNRQRFLSLLAGDKKNHGSGRVSFVLLAAPGVVARGESGGWTNSFSGDAIWNDILDAWRELTNVQRREDIH
jgi:3-dehydroquinate synthase